MILVIGTWSSNHFQAIHFDGFREYILGSSCAVCIKPALFASIAVWIIFCGKHVLLENSICWLCLKLWLLGLERAVSILPRIDFAKTGQHRCVQLAHVTCMPCLNHGCYMGVAMACSLWFVRPFEHWIPSRTLQVSLGGASRFAVDHKPQRATENSLDVL